MAKRYTRINWQQTPSTATPRNATNLNIMDKGIKDCDDAIGDLALLKTSAKTDLVAAVNEQNDNLTVKSLTAGQDLHALTIDGQYRSAVSATVSSLVNKPPEITSGELYLDVKTTTTNYVIQTIYHTSGTNLNIYVCNRAGTNWSAWKKATLV